MANERVEENPRRNAEVERLEREVAELRARARIAQLDAERAKRQLRDFVKTSNRFASSVRAGAEERRRSRQRLNVQYAIGNILAGAANLEEAAPKIFEVFHDMLGWEAGVLWLAAGGTLCCAHTWRAPDLPAGGFEEACRRTTFLPGTGLPGRVWERNEPAWTGDTTESEDRLLREAAPREGLRGAYAFPVRNGGFTGVIELLSREPPVPSESTFHLTSLVGHQIGDFAAKRQAEAERDRLLDRERDAHRRLDSILESISDAFFALDRDRRFTYVNRRAEQFWSTPREELLGKRIWEVFPQATDSVIFRKMRRAMQERTTTGFEAISPVTGLWISGRAYPAPDGGLSVYFQDITGRKEAEKALQRGEEHLRLATRAGRVGTVEWDIRADESWCSDTLAEIFGYAPGEYNPTYEGFLERVHPEDRGRVRNVLDASVAACAPHELEFRIVRPDGSLRWILAKGRIFCDEHGEAERMLGVTLDITRQKRAEAERENLLGELESERTLLEAILKQMPGGTFVADPSGRIILGNEEAARIYRQPFEPMASFEEYARWKTYHLDGRELTPDQYPLVRSLRHGEVVSGQEYKIRRGDGTTGMISVNSSPVYDARGEISAGVVTFYDITGLRKAEEALRRSEERYRSLVTASASIVWNSDAEGRISQEIPSWEVFTGQTFEEYQGFGWLDAVHPDDRKRAAEGRKLTTHAKKPFRAEYRLRSHNGSHRYVVVRGVPIRDRDGEICEWVGTIADVTERKLAEEERERIRIQEWTARAEATERERISRELHDRVAHSMGVAHQSLQLYEALVGTSPSRAEEKLDLAKELVKVSLDTTRNLSSELRRSETEKGLVPALRNLLEITVPDGTHRELSVEGEELSLPEPLRAQVYLILREAVRNAIRHSGCASIKVALSTTPQEIRGSVEDDGRGFAGNGERPAGLGLRSIKERAALLAGTCKVSSTPGSGTRVEVRIPFRKARGS